MPMSSTERSIRGLAALTAALIMTLMAAVASERRDHATPSPTVGDRDEAARLTVGPDACGECHIAELASWKDTAHARGFTDMHRSDEAKRIGEALGIRRIKREAVCVRCHYSEQVDGGESKARWGVTCESCHGPARDWMPVHDDFGGKELTRETESPEHARQRRLDAIEAGMNRPDDLHQLASACFSCHLVDDATVVEKGGHTIGSDFELLSFAAGEVRHNYLASKGKSNQPAAMPRRRQLYLLGQMLEIEHGLRALAAAPASGPYRDGLESRLEAARQALRAVLEKQPIDEVAAALAATDEAAAAAAARRLAQRDCADLGAIDGLLPATTAARGKAHD